MGNNSSIPKSGTLPPAPLLGDNPGLAGGEGARKRRRRAARTEAPQLYDAFVPSGELPSVPKLERPDGLTSRRAVRRPRPQRLANPVLADSPARAAELDDSARVLPATATGPNEESGWDRMFDSLSGQESAPVPSAPVQPPPRRRRRVERTAFAQPSEIEPLPMVPAAREKLDEIFNHHWFSLSTYSDGNAKASTFASMMVEVVRALTYDGPLTTQEHVKDFLEGVEQLEAVIKHDIDIKKYIFPDEDRHYQYPSMRDLKVIAKRLGWDETRFKFLVVATRMIQGEAANAIPWNSPHLRRLTRLLRLSRAFGYLNGIFDIEGKITAALEHGRSGGGAYSDQKAYRERNRGILPIDDVVEFMHSAIKIGAELLDEKEQRRAPEQRTLTHDMWLADVFTVVLGATWGKEEVKVPRYVVRNDFTEVPTGRWYFSKSMSGSALAERGYSAMQSGDVERAAVIFSTLAETHLYRKETKSGYYKAVEELIKAETPPRPSASARMRVNYKEKLAFRAQALKTARKHVAYGVEMPDRDPNVMTSKDWVEYHESGGSNFAMMINAIAEDSALITPMGTEGVNVPALKRFIQTGKGVGPYREFRRTLYGTVAADAWIKAGDAAVRDRPMRAHWMYQMALHSIQVARTRMPILLAYDEGRLGVKLQDVLNPLVMGMSIASIQARIESKISDIRRALLANTDDDTPGNLPPPPAPGNGAGGNDSVATAALRRPNGAPDPNLSMSVELDAHDLAAACGIQQMVLNPAHNVMLGVQAFFGLRPLVPAF